MPARIIVPDPTPLQARQIAASEDRLAALDADLAAAAERAEQEAAAAEAERVRAEREAAAARRGARR